MIVAGFPCDDSKIKSYHGFNPNFGGIWCGDIKYYWAYQIGIELAILINSSTLLSL